MYSSAMDYGRESGSVLFPTRFVWPYGGRSVYLSGSFTGWSQWPMTPVEGCPTVFQTICSIPPGYHQYKFIVDGEWRHDENLPSVNSNYGTVNTVLLARESDYLPSMMNPQVPPVSMDVDNEAFQRLVRVSDGVVHEALSRISDTDLEIFRQCISAFLSTHTAYELLPESGKVIALDVDLPVKQAFHILHEQGRRRENHSMIDSSLEVSLAILKFRTCLLMFNDVLASAFGINACTISESSYLQGISTAPLWDFSKGQFVGVLSALDFILIVRELGSDWFNLTEEELETHTISGWKEIKSYVHRQMIEHGSVTSRQLVHAGPDDNLKDVALKLLQNGVATVPVINSTSDDGLYPQLLHLASLSGILKIICRYFRHSLASLPILHFPICLIPVGTWIPKIGEPNRRPLAMLRPNASLGAALNLLVQAQVSSIPIVDDNDSLLDIYSRSDITALAKDKIYKHIKLEEMTIHQALQLGEEPYSSLVGGNQRCHMCLRSDPLYKVMERLSKPGVRRLVIVEAGSKRVEGIVSLTDVFRFLLG